MESRREKESSRLKEYSCPKSEDLGTSGVLLSNEIKYYAEKYKMIDPFVADNLKPAAYELTVGHEFSLGGVPDELEDRPGEDTIQIPPFEVAIIKTRETLNLPRFIIARWNLRVKWAYEGLLWIGGPQVDPGWVGHLFCPIYNLSDKERSLRLGDRIAVIDFVKTTPFEEKVCEKYDRPSKRFVLGDYYPRTLESALVNEARKKIKEIEETTLEFQRYTEKKVDGIGGRVDTYFTIILAIIALLVTALSIFVTSAQDPIKTLPWWTYMFVLFSAAAILWALAAYILSIYSYARSARSSGEDRNGKSH